MRLIILFCLGLGLLLSQVASAKTFQLPADGNSIVGKVSFYEVKKGENFATIARQYDLGYYALVEANPGVNPDQPKLGAVLIIPGAHVLPKVPYKGIVINLAEMTLYYFPKGKHEVMVYPVGIGRLDWTTPTGKMKIIQKKKHPAWYVPESIRKARLKDGVKLPKMVPPGPKNPLGNYMLRLSRPTYLIHGTNDPSGVGRRSSAGCIRMYPEDIEALFTMTKIDIPVNIINHAFMAGWESNRLYLEAHLPLQEQQTEFAGSKEAAVKAVEQANKGHQSKVNWAQVLQVASDNMGLPRVVGTGVS